MTMKTNHIKSKVGMRAEKEIMRVLGEVSKEL